MHASNIALLNVFFEKMTLNKFLHNISKWDFSVKVKICRNGNTGRPCASYSTAEASKPKQGAVRRHRQDLSGPSLKEPFFFFQLHRNLNEGFATDAQNGQQSITVTGMSQPTSYTAMKPVFSTFFHRFLSAWRLTSKDGNPTAYLGKVLQSFPCLTVWKFLLPQVKLPWHISQLFCPLLTSLAVQNSLLTNFTETSMPLFLPFTLSSKNKTTPFISGSEILDFQSCCCSSLSLIVRWLPPPPKLQ